MGQQHPVAGGHHHAPYVLTTGLGGNAEREGTPNRNEAADEDDGLKEIPGKGRWPSVAEAKDEDHVGEQEGQDRVDHFGGDKSKGGLKGELDGRW